MGKEFTFFLSPILLSALAFCLIPQFSPAQHSELGKEWQYSTRLPEYQQWLQEAGSGSALQTHSIEVHNGMLHLFVEFTYDKIDSTMAAWETMKQRFEYSKGFNLEQQLFFTACNLLKVPPYLLTVKLINKQREERFYYTIGYDMNNREVQLKAPPLNFKAANMVIDVGSVKNRPLIINTSYDLTSIEAVYATILEMARNNYAAKIDIQNKVYGKDLAYFGYLPGNEDVLHFSVVGLRQEILKEEDNIWIGKMLNWLFNTQYYDWRKVENIQFTITCKILSKRKMRIDCNIEGRYGSGVYRTTEWRKCIPMEPEFGWYVQKYSDDFKNQIYDLFTR